jgi:hypothetical protein
MVKAMETKKKVRIAILAIGAKTIPELGVFSPTDLSELLEKYFEEGYDLFSVQPYEHVRALDTSPDHFWSLYVFKLKE